MVLSSFIIRQHLSKFSCFHLHKNLSAMSKTAYQPVTHVIFDLDGTILDTETIYKRAFSDVAERHGKVYTTEIQAKVLGRVEIEGAEVAVKEMQLPLSPQQFLDQYKEVANQFLGSPDFMPGAEKLVQHLHSHKIPIAVATSSTTDSFALKSQKYKEFFSMFSHVVTGGSDPEVKKGKPNPDIFLVCASRFGDKPKPEECLVIEDAPNGVQAAVAAGMQVIMVPDKLVEESLCKQATVKLNSLTEVKPELFGLPPL